MKQKKILLENRCTENWDNMDPSANGRFCDVCSKSVSDFTMLSQAEISERLRNSHGSLCAKITKTQLNLPLLEVPEQNLNFDYLKISASVFLAAAMTTAQPLHAQNNSTQTELVANTEAGNQKVDLSKRAENKTSASKGFINFKGIVTSGENSVPVVNAKVTFITAQKYYSAYTSKGGTFSMELPSEHIDDDNVIRVTYEEIEKPEATPDTISGFEQKDYVLTKEQIHSKFKVTAKVQEYLFGEIRVVIASIGETPIVLSNGVEVNYGEFVKARVGGRKHCTLANKKVDYFEPEAAIAIYGDKARMGLYIVRDF